MTNDDQEVNALREPKLISRTRTGYALHLAVDERAVVSGLLDELRSLLTDRATDAAGLHRLFPVVHPEDPEAESEYQRLTRDDLVTSRVAGIDAVRAVLDGGGRKVTFDEAGLLALMQALNGVRLVLGTLLDVHEDDEPTDAATPEFHLYAFLSWMLDACVRAASGED